MQKLLAVIFSDELKAYEGSRALNELDSEGSISIHAKVVIRKNPDGTASIEQSKEEFPLRTMEGTAIGALVGLLGGPIGFGLGVGAGTLAGAVADVHRSGVNEDFVAEISTKLTPGKCAVIAEISEEWTAPVDSRMEILGGKIYRADRSDFENEQRAREVADIRTEIAQLKAERAQAHAGQKQKLQAKIGKLQKRLHVKLQQTKRRSEQQRKEAQANIQALKKKASKAKGGKRAALESRIASIRNESTKSQAHAKWLQTFELPAEKEMLSEMEVLYRALPFEDYAKDEEKLRRNVDRLENEYDRREKVIGRIIKHGTGIETEKALRMYPTPVLTKWEASLQTFRTAKLKKKAK